MKLSEQRQQDKERVYRCGRCHFDIPYTCNEEAPIPCPECSWAHKTRTPNDVPSQVKLDLSKYGG